MLSYLTLIFVCQLLGELMTGALAIPVPGPVLGMVLLLIFLVLRRQVPEELDRTATGLLGAMSLLFVPAGAGVMMHFRLLGEALVPLGVALIVSTVLTILVTGLMMRWLGKGAGE